MTCISPAEIENLERMAHRIRQDVIEMFHVPGKGHIGGSLSIVEVIVALYYHIMNVDPKNPRWPDRDRMILSKGHASATWYAVLAAKGYFPRDLLFTDFIAINGILQEHAEMKNIPGVDMSSGSLAQGLSVGLGMSLAARLNQKNYRIYVVMGDGEMQSGQVWEALMACAHYRANNITAIIDYNKLQVSDLVCKVIDIEPLSKKLEAFGWRVLEIDGNNMAEVVEALVNARDNSASAPTAVICHTVKGKGVSFMENSIPWHANAFTEPQYQQAKRELANPIPSKGGQQNETC